MNPEPEPIRRHLEILYRTPSVLRSLLDGITGFWSEANEGPDTWSPRQVIAHLIHGEKTDWIPRIRHILARDPSPFEVFDRFAHLRDGRELQLLLEEFENLREQNLSQLEGFGLSEEDLNLPGLHPGLGAVNLGQLIATWAVHDLAHISQISRVMTRRLHPEVGPWKAYFSLLKDFQN